MYSANGLVMAERKGVCIALWHRKPTQELFDIQKKCLNDVVSRNKGKSAFLCVVESTSEPPDDDIRKASSQMISSYEMNLHCVALVIEGTGFRSAITRTVLSGIYMLTRTPAPVRFFDTPAAACNWVGAKIPAARDGLQQEIEVLRALIAAH
jgi:hypothetical protein